MKTQPTMNADQLKTFAGFLDEHPGFSPYWRVLPHDRGDGKAHCHPTSPQWEHGGIAATSSGRERATAVTSGASRRLCRKSVEKVLRFGTSSCRLGGRENLAEKDTPFRREAASAVKLLFAFENYCRHNR
jgi:hypothetical protein